MSFRRHHRRCRHWSQYSHQESSSSSSNVFEHESSSSSSSVYQENCIRWVPAFQGSGAGTTYWRASIPHYESSSSSSASAEFNNDSHFEGRNRKKCRYCQR